MPPIALQPAPQFLVYLAAHLLVAAEGQPHVLRRGVPGLEQRLDGLADRAARRILIISYAVFCLKKKKTENGQRITISQDASRMSSLGTQENIKKTVWTGMGS